MEQKQSVAKKTPKSSSLAQLHVVPSSEAYKSNPPQGKFVQSKSPKSVTPKSICNVSFESRNGVEIAKPLQKDDAVPVQQIDLLLGFDDDQQMGQQNKKVMKSQIDGVQRVPMPQPKMKSLQPKSAPQQMFINKSIQSQITGGGQMYFQNAKQNMAMADLKKYQQDQGLANYKEQDAITMKVKSLLQYAPVTESQKDKQIIEFIMASKQQDTPGTTLTNNSHSDGRESIPATEANKTFSNREETKNQNQSNLFLKKTKFVQNAPKIDQNQKVSSGNNNQKFLKPQQNGLLIQKQNFSQNVPKPSQLQTQSSCRDCSPSNQEKTFRMNQKGPITTPSNKNLRAKESKSQSRTNKIETPEESRLAIDAFTQLGLPNFYKLDKLQYSRSEIADLGCRLSKKMQMYDQLLEYERVKNEQSEKDKIEMRQQIEKLHIESAMAENHKVKNNCQNSANKFGMVVHKLEECLNSLKDSMIHNFVCIQFYKDLQTYISDNHFEEEQQNQHAMVQNRHIHEINRIINDNKLSQMQLDSDLLEQVRDDTADFLRLLQQENENLSERAKRTVTIDLNRSCGDAESNIKVRVQRPRSNIKTALDDAGSALMARAQSGSRGRVASPTNCSGNASFLIDRNKPHWDKHHTNCVQDNQHLLKAEVNARMLQNVKLKEERDQLKKKIIDLRTELVKVKEKTWRKQQVEELREKVKKYEKQLSSQDYKNKNTTIEVAALREENNHLQAKLKQTQETLKVEEGFKLEFKNALENAEHFQNLRDSVNQITGMLVSKKSRELSAQQKASLQIIFGDSSVLHTLRHRLAESESYSAVLSKFLSDILKICLAIKSKIVQVWRLLQQFSNGFNQVKEDEIHNINLLMLKNISAEQMSEEKLLVFETLVDTEFAKLNNLIREMSKQSMLEEISKQLVDQEERINLHELIEVANQIDLVSPYNVVQQNQSGFCRNKSAQKSQSFALANVTQSVISAQKQYGQAQLKNRSPSKKRQSQYAMNSSISVKPSANNGMFQNSVLLSPNQNSFLVQSQVGQSNAAPPYYNMISTEAAEQEEASAQDIQHFQLINKIDNSPYKDSQHQKTSIQNFINDIIIIEDDSKLQNQAQIDPDLESNPLDKKSNSENQVVMLGDDEDSFLEFIREKPQIGHSPSTRKIYAQQDQKAKEAVIYQMVNEHSRQLAQDQSSFGFDTSSSIIQNERANSNLAQVTYPKIEKRQELKSPKTHRSPVRQTDAQDQKNNKSNLKVLPPEFQGLFKGAESSDEEPQPKRNVRKSPNKNMRVKDGGISEISSYNGMRGSQKSQRKANHRSAIKEEHSQLQSENEQLKKAMAQFQDKYNKMMIKSSNSQQQEIDDKADKFF